MESKWLDSESCASFRIFALDSINVLDSESALDSVDSKFLRIAFSRIFSNFLESCVCAKRKGVYPLSPHSQSPEKNKAPRFCCALLATRWLFCAATKYIFWRECLAISLSSQKC
ncbi:hypothetical protein [uncultured Helicobacter sp.]|uniref:hypothetical protein n=1 Tax=uncultured Helicobacter sp. TaxID=175537 RepID=UPI003750606D